MEGEGIFLSAAANKNKKIMDCQENGKHDRQKLLDKYVRYLFLASAGLMTAMMLAVILFVGQQGLQTFQSVGIMEFFFSSKWDPLSQAYGAASFIAGSLLTTVLAVLIGAPLGVAGAVFMAKVAPSAVREILRPAADLYVAIPSVVYGFVGLTILVPLVRDFFGQGSGFGILVTSIILAIMILPTVISISEDALRLVPTALEEASLALGATRWQTLWRVLIPAAMPGILTSVILAMARAIGETMAVQMIIGNTPQFPLSLLMPTATLTSEIVVEMGNTPFGSTWGNSLFLMALVLLVVSLLMILMIRRIAHREVE